MNKIAKTPDELLEKNEDLRNKLKNIEKKLDAARNENIKSKGLNMIALALAFTAVAVTALYQAIEIHPLWSGLVFIVYMGCSALILYHVIKISATIKNKENRDK